MLQVCFYSYFFCGIMMISEPKPVSRCGDQNSEFCPILNVFLLELSICSDQLHFQVTQTTQWPNSIVQSL